jgi:cell division protein FtsX
MTWYMTAAVVLVIAVAIFVAYAFCVVAAEADATIERLRDEAKEAYKR